MIINSLIIVLEVITRANLIDNNGLSTVAMVSIIFAALLLITLGVVIVLYMFKSKNKRNLNRKNK